MTYAELIWHLIEELQNKEKELNHVNEIIQKNNIQLEELQNKEKELNHVNEIIQKNNIQLESRKPNEVK